MFDSFGALRSGFASIVSGSAEETEPQPEAYGPLNGPAPNGDTERSPVVKFDVVVDENTVYPAEVQFWMPEGGGGIFGAWNVNGQQGDAGVLDREDGKFWFGSKPFWTESGVVRPCVDLSETVEEELWDAFSSLMARHQTRNFGILSEGVEDEGVFNGGPAPGSRVEGDSIDAPVVSNTSKLPGRFELWRPESSGAIYVAWQIGDQSGRYGILHAAGLWLGKDEQFRAPNGVVTPFLYIGDESVKKKFERQVESVRDSIEDEPLECGGYTETLRANHPDSPGRSNPWDGEDDEL